LLITVNWYHSKENVVILNNQLPAKTETYLFATETYIQGTTMEKRKETNKIASRIKETNISQQWYTGQIETR